MLYLVVVDLFLIGVLSLQGEMALMPLVLGLVLAIPNLLGNLAGAAMFHPDRQMLYRVFGYVVMITVGLSGLPLWDG